jgi:hypothetical protein
VSTTHTSQVSGGHPTATNNTGSGASHAGASQTRGWGPQAQVAKGYGCGHAAPLTHAAKGKGGRQTQHVIGRPHVGGQQRLPSSDETLRFRELATVFRNTHTHTHGKKTLHASLFPQQLMCIGGHSLLHPKPIHNPPPTNQHIQIH